MTVRRKVLVMGASGFVGSHVTRKLVETNVESLRRVLDIAVDVDFDRFVFCSTIGTIAIAENGESATEDMPFNWEGVGGAYIESRRKAEDLVLEYALTKGVPTVAMCVSNPYGPLDWQPHQGMMVKAAALEKMPVYVKGVCTEVVGIEDVADGFLLAAERGRIGERYIISESFMPMRQMFETAASAVGAKPLRIGVPLAMVYAVGWIMGAASRILRRDLSMNVTGVKLLHMMSAADHSKATRELGWEPRPTAESNRRAAQFYVENS